LDDKSVKLFKLFKNNTTVKFEMSQVALDENSTQTVLKFSNSTVDLMTIMPESSIISSVPALNIRAMANKNYPYEVVLNKEDLLEVLNRLNIFNTDSRMLVKVDISGDNLTISSLNNEFVETLKTSGGSSVEDDYSFYLILKNLKLILDGYIEQYITMCFGDNKAIVFKKQGVVDMIPEPRVTN